MTLPHSEAREEFLNGHRSDLYHIREFQEWKGGRISYSEYKGTFKKFLVRFGVFHGISKNAFKPLMDYTLKRIGGSNPDDVDDFAMHLRDEGPAFGSTMTSLASKILMLNQPEKITPIDSNVRRAVKLSRNNYAEYKSRFDRFLEEHRQEIQDNLTAMKSDFCCVEREFIEKIQEIEKIRLNRYVDKLLWVIGWRMMNQR